MEIFPLNVNLGPHPSPLGTTLWIYDSGEKTLSFG